MKVCFVNALFYPFRGGTENHMLELGEALVKQGVEVHVVTAQLKGTLGNEVVKGITVHRVPSEVIKVAGLYPPPLVLCPNFLKYLRDIDKKEDFDLFHLHGRWFPDFTVVRKHCKETGKPFLLTVHNARPIGISAFYTVFGSAYEAALGKNVLKSADKLIAVSKWTGDDVAKYGLDKRKLSVIYNGVNAFEFSTKCNPKVKKQLGMKESDALLVWVGRVIEQKGLKYLIAAMPKVLKVHPAAKLLIIGTGTELAKLKQRTTKLGLTGSVVFHGVVNNRKELNDLLRGSDLFVFPSIWEPFGMVIIEAMASGLPVVASRTGGIPEIVSEKTGWLVAKRNPIQLAKAINTALNNPSKLRKMGATGRKVAEEQFNWSKIALETVKVYNSALATPRPKIEWIDYFELSSAKAIKKVKTAYSKQLKRIGKGKNRGKLAKTLRKLWQQANR